MPLNESNIPYCTVNRVYEQYGRPNVEIWADVDGDRDPVKIKNTIESAILDASRMFDDLARGGVIEVGFEPGQVPRSVQYAVACRAAWQLYTSRGMFVKDWDKAFDRIMCEFERVAGQVHDGTIKLAVDAEDYVAGMTPGAVSDGTERVIYRP